MAKKKYRITKNPELLAEKVLEYFYKHPEANTSKEMEKVFNVCHRRIRIILTKHFKEKFENSIARRCALIDRK